MALSFCPFLCLFFGHFAFATPVYLNPESLHPSGHHPRPWLETRTKDVQVQMWYHVQTRDNKFGWVAEDHILSRIKLSTAGFTNSEVPLRVSPRLEAVSGRTLPMGRRVFIREISGSWARVSLEDSTQGYWVPTHFLMGDDLSPALAFIRSRVSVGGLRVSEGALVEVVGVAKLGVHIRYRGKKTVIARNQVFLREDLPREDVLVLRAQLPLRSAPLPNADLVRPLGKFESVRVSETKLLKWGQVRVAQAGLVWWPISEDFSDAWGATQEENHISTEELFSRKIFDMASSPAIPNLKFVSASGVFRSLDGRKWIRLAQFGDQNFPIATAKSGAIFIGPFVSYNHGENFRTYIKWDRLISNIGSADPALGSKLRILAIQPKDPLGKRLQLKLDVGHNRAVLMEWDMTLASGGLPEKKAPPAKKVKSRRR